MSRYAAADLQPKKHKTRQTADGTFVFVGFPLTNLDKFTDIMQEIPAYPLEGKSPIETMVFVSDLKKKLSAII